MVFLYKALIASIRIRRVGTQSMQNSHSPVNQHKKWKFLKTNWRLRGCCHMHCRYTHWKFKSQLSRHFWQCIFWFVCMPSMRSLCISTRIFHVYRRAYIHGICIHTHTHSHVQCMYKWYIYTCVMYVDTTCILVHWCIHHIFTLVQLLCIIYSNGAYVRATHKGTFLEKCPLECVLEPETASIVFLMVKNPIPGVVISVLTSLVRNLVLSFEMHPLWDKGPRIESRPGKCILLFSGIFQNFKQMTFERNSNALGGFRPSWNWCSMFRGEIPASWYTQKVQQEVHLCTHACTYYVRQVLEFLDLHGCFPFSSRFARRVEY
jgi:hypothetical protein